MNLNSPEIRALFLRHSDSGACRISKWFWRAYVHFQIYDFWPEFYMNKYNSPKQSRIEHGG